MRAAAFLVAGFFLSLVLLVFMELGGTDGKPLSPEAPKHEAVQARAQLQSERSRFLLIAQQELDARLEAERAEAARQAAERQRAAEAEKRRRAAMERRTVTGTTQPRTAPSRSGVNWDAIARCESNGRWNLNTGNNFYGGLQFMLSSWRAVGGTGYPHEHSRETQIVMAERLSNGGRNLRHWPVCGRHG